MCSTKQRLEINQLYNLSPNGEKIPICNMPLHLITIIHPTPWESFQ